MNEDFQFKAVIQAGDGGGAFVFFPFDMLKSFGTSGRCSSTGPSMEFRSGESYLNTVSRSLSWAY